MMKYSLVLAIAFILIGCSPKGNKNVTENVPENENVTSQNLDKRGLDEFFKTADEGSSIVDSVDNIYIIMGISGYLVFDENSDKVLLDGLESCKIGTHGIECLKWTGRSSNNKDTLKTITFPDEYELDKSNYCIYNQFVIDIQSHKVNKSSEKVDYCYEH